ncbi:hypothetical protein V5E97_13335 [Singulisphaera sp. Ch08]|uniref:Uncharacterized protein n=1 Tax=Singulisphaera sp. Ch08 TaxID=3120278 RepID=A0AAU7CPI9_9BACT
MMTVTLGLAGFGDAYFDDLKIETVEGSGPGRPDQYADNPVKRTVPGAKPAAGAATPATAAGKRGTRRDRTRR